MSPFLWAAAPLREEQESGCDDITSWGIFTPDLDEKALPGDVTMIARGMAKGRAEALAAAHNAAVLAALDAVDAKRKKGKR